MRKKYPLHVIEGQLQNFHPQSDLHMCPSNYTSAFQLQTLNANFDMPRTHHRKLWKTKWIIVATYKPPRPPRKHGARAQLRSEHYSNDTTVSLNIYSTNKQSNCCIIFH